MEQEYDFEGLERLEAREEGDSEFVEAYSDLGDLKVREKGEELEFVWETGSGFEDVLEAVEMFYRRENSIQFLEKDDITLIVRQLVLIMPNRSRREFADLRVCWQTVLMGELPILGDPQGSIVDRRFPGSTGCRSVMMPSNWLARLTVRLLSITASELRSPLCRKIEL